MITNEFLGHSAKYWLELQSKAEALNVTKLIEENADLRAKVNFYEQKVTEMLTFKVTINSRFDILNSIGR